MNTRGVRGAIDVPTNSREAIFESTITLLKEMLAKNSIPIEEIASIFLTVTPDLNADFPAYAARQMGLSSAPLLCAQEIDVPGAMKNVVRALIHFNTSKQQSEIVHCYLGKTIELRPDQGEKN